MQNAPIFLLNGEVIWQASDSSLSKELHDLGGTIKLVLKNGPFLASFSFIFVFSIQLTGNNFLQMTGFEARRYGTGRDRSTNCATTTAPTTIELLPK